MTANAKPGIGLLFLAWLVLFVGISALLWIAIQFWGSRLNLGVSPGAAATPAGRGLRVLPPANNAPVLDLEEVTESNARLSFVGRMVRFEDVTVVEVGQTTFRIGRNGGKTLLAVPSEPEPPDVTNGERVNVSGLILDVPQIAAIQRRWGLDRAEAARLALEQVYLRASTIEKR